VNTITFSGYQWDVRADTGGPGPNIWDAANVQVDDEGRLHLTITKNTGTAGKTEWHCAEINTQQRLGVGRYQFQVIGRIDKLDRNVVLGLFNHPTRGDVGRPDGTNEIDIEFAQWGKAAAKTNADYVVLPESLPDTHKDTDRILFKFALNGDNTTHRFLWQNDRVTFQSLHGHRDNDAHEFERWLYMPSPPGGLIPQLPTPVHINLWLVGGKPPSDRAEVEIIISQFTFVPFDPPSLEERNANAKD
jgi:hypothetical protein